MTQMVTRNGSKRTAASMIADEMKLEILAGTLPPGARLKVEQLRRRFDTAINPVREALNRLASEGLVTLEDHKGFSVAPISLADWRDLLEARCMIETTALRRSIANADDDWRDEVVVSLDRLLRIPRHFDADRTQPNPDWEPVHHRFHNSLLTRCGSATTIRICEDLRMRADRYRVLAGRAQSSRRTYNDEHEAIASAALAGDADRAVQSLDQHYRMTIKVVERYFDFS